MFHLRFCSDLLGQQELHFPMKILCNSDDLVGNLKRKHLFLDANTLILALDCEPLLKLLHTLREHDCLLVTLDPVIFQFLRGQDMLAYQKRLKFISDLRLTILPCDEIAFEHAKTYFPIVTKGMPKGDKGSGRVDFVDYYLVLALLQFTSSCVMTENYHDMPLSILDRTQIITIDTDREVRHQAVYTVNQKKLQTALEEVEKHLS